MKSKYNYFIENITWEIVSLPTITNVITNQWVFNPKND